MESDIDGWPIRLTTDLSHWSDMGMIDLGM